MLSAKSGVFPVIVVAARGLTRGGGIFEGPAELGDEVHEDIGRTVCRLKGQSGVTLLRRSTRAIELTPEGRDLLVAAQDIVTRTEAPEDLAARSAARRGPLRANAPVSKPRST